MRALKLRIFQIAAAKIRKKRRKAALLKHILRVNAPPHFFRQSISEDYALSGIGKPNVGRIYRGYAF